MAKEKGMLPEHSFKSYNKSRLLNTAHTTGCSTIVRTPGPLETFN